jgi:glycolate oxidase iron-sulfur subunit
VQYGFLLERARTAAAATRGVPLLERLLLASVAGRWRGPAMAGARLLRATRLPSLLARLLPAGAGRLRFALAMLAVTARSPLAGAGRGRGGDPAGTARPTQPADSPAAAPMRVALLEGCVQRGLYGHVNRATARVLAVNGARLVASPGQGCCGALHAHAGDLAGARRMAKQNVHAFAASGAERVVVNAAGCGAFLKEYAALFERDPSLSRPAAEFAAKVRDVHEALLEAEPRVGAPLPLRVAYDSPCHLEHGQRAGHAPLAVLATVPGLEVVPVSNAAECCGGAGTYGLENPELGGRILADKLAAVRTVAADVVATPNAGCMMQIGAGLRMAGEALPVVHPVELVDESYRRAGLYAEDT